MECAVAELDFISLTALGQFEVGTPVCFGRAGGFGAQQATMSFFVTSVGKGNGADLGGLAGADAHCQALALAREPTGSAPSTQRPPRHKA